MPDSYQYDAFISYRHLPLDSAVAERVQKLLENFKAPIKSEDGKRMRINRIFRDRTELPTSGNLDDSLKQALLASRFLIVVLSKETKNSKWCMEEIRLFKQANNGSISHIIPILIEGEPDEVIPDILRTEKREKLLDDGSTGLCEVEVEPLCCDIRSDSLKGSLKLLKTEYLRICASILGVGFDDLYRRHRRRKKKIAITTACIALALLICISAVISIFAFQAYNERRQKQVKLIENFTQKGVQMMAEGDYEKALAYYNNVLELDSENQAAKTGSLLLLQQYGWLNEVSSEKGFITQEVLYNVPSRASAVDSEGKRFLRASAQSYYVADANDRNLESLDEFGKFISCAKDGSCWSFVNNSKITFYFPDNSSYYQVDKPTKINPLCPEGYASALTEDNASTKTSAMAIGKKRAAVCYGGYLYFYKLDSRTFEASLYETVDLSLALEYESENQTVSNYYNLWADPNGKYCVVSNGNGAAVFNVSDNKELYICAIRSDYWQMINNAVFSDDGEHYAIVYGNCSISYNNPGGCIRVFDENGNECFATEFDEGTPLTNAMFAPDSELIAAWGYGELQIWNWSTQSAVTAPLQLSDISTAVWVDNERIAVSDEKGIIKYFIISHLEPEVSDVELKTFEEPDFYSDTFKINSEYTFHNYGISLAVEDSKQQTTDEYKFEYDYSNLTAYDESSRSIYAFNSLDSLLVNIKVDENGKITYAKELNTHGKNPVSVYFIPDGIIAVMGDGDILWYKNERTDPEGIIHPGVKGKITCIAFDKSGLLSFVIRNQNLLGGIHYEYTYTAELWDLNNFVKLTVLENSTQRITDLTFTSDNRFAYSLYGEKRILILDIPSPDKKAISTLKKMSCYDISESGKVLLESPSFDYEALGNWKDYFIKNDKASKEQNVSVRSEMKSILKDKGKKVWIEEFNKWWESGEPEKKNLSELCEIISSYYFDAIANGYTKEAKTGIIKYFEIFDNSATRDYSHAATAGQMTSIVLAFSPELTDTVKAHLKSSAEYYEALYEAAEDDESSYNYLISAYGYRIQINLLEGKGLKSFDIDKSIMNGLYSENKKTLMNNELVKVYVYLLSSKPKQAAKQFEQSYNTESSVDYWDLLLELNGYVKNGILPEKDYSEFVRELKYPTGTKLGRINMSQLKAGLKPGDVVVAVNGFYYGTPLYYLSGKKVTPEKLTFIRNEEISTVKAEPGWKLLGIYPV